MKRQDLWIFWDAEEELLFESLIHLSVLVSGIWTFEPAGKLFPTLSPPASPLLSAHTTVFPLANDNPDSVISLACFIIYVFGFLFTVLMLSEKLHYLLICSPYVCGNRAGCNLSCLKFVGLFAALNEASSLWVRVQCQTVLGWNNLLSFIKDVLVFPLLKEILQEALALLSFAFGEFKLILNLIVTAAWILFDRTLDLMILGTRPGGSCTLSLWDRVNLGSSDHLTGSLCSRIRYLCLMTNWTPVSLQLASLISVFS